MLVVSLLLTLAALSKSPAALASSSKRPRTAADAIRAEIAELEKSISRSAKPDPNFVASVSRAKGEIESGRIFAALYRLQSPFSESEMRSYLASKSAISRLPQFETEWARAGKEISREDAGLDESRIAKLPAAARALVEVNRAEGRVFYKSALLYGRETEAGNGLAYVGLAKGNLDFAAWVSSLAFEPAGPSAARSPKSEIGELEQRVLQAYDRPGKPIPPGQFENINSKLKAAGELDRDGKFDGAVSQYLDAEFYFDLVSSEGRPAENLEALRRASREALGRMEGSATDQSLGRMIWELAEGNLAPERDGSVPPEKLARAEVQLERVLPRYFGLGEKAAAQRPAPDSGPAKVRITLVRWPYT